MIGNYILMISAQNENPKWQGKGWISYSSEWRKPTSHTAAFWVLKKVPS